MDKVKISIIGAGVVGLAIAEALSRKIDGDIAVFEKHDSFGQETSSRNSEVIHAGIYYPKDSLKSRLCLEGNKLLYQFCGGNGIKHQRCGKIIISTNEAEAKKIESIYAKAVLVGVPDLKLLTREEVLALEPKIFALNGIFSGSTGIIDSHGLMNCLFKKAEKNEVMFALGDEVMGIKKVADGYVITTENGNELLSEVVVNAAGLNSDKVAQMAGFDVDKLGYRLHYCKGDYFSITGSKNKLNHLVYPVPHEKGHGLGVHATLDLDGFIKLGPDTEYVEKLYYDVDPGKKNDFYKAVKTYLPWVEEAMLAPDTAGMRPKLQGPDDEFRDFVIMEERANGFPGFINLIGIESPGLTSCLAIGKYLENLVK